MITEFWNTVEMAGGDINTLLCPIKVNSNTIELTLCYLLPLNNCLPIYLQLLNFQNHQRSHPDSGGEDSGEADAGDRLEDEDLELEDEEEINVHDMVIKIALKKINTIQN